MMLLKFVLRNCTGMMVFTAIASLASGACNAGLIGMVNHILNHPGAPTGLVIAGFVSLGLGKVLTGFASQVLLTKFSQGVIARLRQDLVRRILSVPLRHLENVGTPRLMVALTEDVLNITQALLGIPYYRGQYSHSARRSGVSGLALLADAFGDERLWRHWRGHLSVLYQSRIPPTHFGARSRRQALRSFPGADRGREGTEASSQSSRSIS
jgi:ABC-type multidrug transport system fused ATPase/permease subunit